MNITPTLVLYGYRVDEFIKNMKRNPTKDEKIEIYAKADYDYKHATIPAKVKLENIAKMKNQMDDIEKTYRKKSKLKKNH